MIMMQQDPVEQGGGTSAAEVFDRLKDMFGFRTDRELADFLGSSASMISRQREHDNLPYKRIVEQCADENLNYIFYGSAAVHEARKTVVLDIHLPGGVDVDVRR